MSRKPSQPQTNAQIANKLVANNGDLKSDAWNSLGNYTAILQWLDTLGITQEVWRQGRVLTVPLDVAVQIILNSDPFNPADFPRGDSISAHNNDGYLELMRDWYERGVVLFKKGARLGVEMLQQDPRVFDRMLLRNVRTHTWYEARNGMWLYRRGKNWKVYGNE